MSQTRNVTLWARPSFSADRWIKQLPTGFNPAADIVQDGDDAVIRVELPGVDVTKDVNVEVEDGRLVIHGERRDETTDESRRLTEVRYGSFRRSFTLPEHVTGDDVAASYEAGVLTVRVTGAYKKPEIPGAQRISIESK